MYRSTKIMAHIKNFYEGKYKRKINKTSLDCKNFLKHIKVPQLSETDNRIHNKPITQRASKQLWIDMMTCWI